MLIGTAFHALLLPGPFKFRPRLAWGPAVVTLDVHTLLYGGAMVLVGAQAMFFAACRHGLRHEGLFRRKLRALVSLPINLETASSPEPSSSSTGLVSSPSPSPPGQRDFGPSRSRVAMRFVVPSVVLLALGAQTIFSSFLGMGVAFMARPRKSSRALRRR